MSAFSDDLKLQADIVKLIGETVALQPMPTGARGLCPFHGEKTPSFHVHAQRRFFYCFGCHACGDVYAFFMQLQKLSFTEAVALVAERTGVPLPRAFGGEPADPLRAELLRIHELATAFFRQTLDSPAGAPARAYLEGRAVDAAAAATFQLGYAPDSGRALVRHLESAGVAPALALRAGLCQLRRESASASTPEKVAWVDLYDRFRGRLIFPIADERGRVIAFGARALGEAGADRNAPKYLNSPESPIYTKGRVLYNLDRARDAIRALPQPYFILVEGYLDCLRVYHAGFHNVVASCGTALTPAQLSQAARHARTALINFDPDAAGSAAAERSIGLMLEESFDVRVVTLADGLDPDLFIRRHGKDAYVQALKQARPYFDYLALRARAQFDWRRPQGKLEALNHLLPFLARVQNPLTRQSLAENLADQLQVDQPIVRKELARAARDRSASLRAASTEATSALLPAELVVLRCWLEWESLRAVLAGILQSEMLLEGLASAPLLERLQAHGEVGDFATLAGQLEPAERRLLADLMMGNLEPLTESHINAALEALRERRHISSRRRVQQDVQRAAAAGDRAGLEALLQSELAARKAGRDRLSRP